MRHTANQNVLTEDHSQPIQEQLKVSLTALFVQLDEYNLDVDKIQRYH